jgi:hypothetical protein
MIKKINKKINLSRRRIRNFYSNIIAGIITGGIIGGFLTIIQSFTGVKYSWPSFLQVLIFVFMFIFLYLFGKNSLSKITQNKDELKNYKSNVQAGFCASLFVTLLLIFQNVWIRLLIIFPLAFIFVIILYVIAGRKKH